MTSHEMLIFLAVVYGIPVALTGTCENPLEDEQIVQNGTINLEKIIKRVEKTLKAKNIKEKKTKEALDCCTNDTSCYVQFKVTNDRTLEICVRTNNVDQHVCLVRTCSCGDVEQITIQPKSSDTCLHCSDQIKNLTKETGHKNISCNDIKDEYEELTTIEPEKRISVKVGIISNEISKDTTISHIASAQMSRKGFLKGGFLWFIAGIACGIIITMLICYVYKRRERTKSQQLLSNNNALFSSDVTEEATYSEVTDQIQSIHEELNGNNTLVYLGVYLEPTKRNGNLEPQHDARSRSYKLPIRTEDNMRDTSDLYDHVYNHLQSNCNSRHLLQEHVENYSSIHEINASINNSQDLGTEKKETPDDSPGEEENYPSNVLHSQESAENRICPYTVFVPDVPSDSEEKPKENAGSFTNQVLSKNDDFDKELLGNLVNSPKEGEHQPRNVLNSQESSKNGTGSYIDCIPDAPADFEEKTKRKC